MKPTIVRTLIDTRGMEASHLEEELAVVTSVIKIQDAGQPSQEHIDMIVRSGFQKDTVYEIKFKRTHGQQGYQMLRVNPDLQLIMAGYEGIETPEALVGRKILLGLEHNCVKSIGPAGYSS